MREFRSCCPVPGRMTNDQWNWLCNNVGTPQKDWVVRKGAVWFKEEQHRTLYVLRWA